MKCIKNFFLFNVGGAGYVLLEVSWRGWSHVSMFLAGGSCFLLLGQLQKRCRKFSWLYGAGVVTAVELFTGLLVNRQYQVWDYRHLPLNLLGQVCLPFTLLWIPISGLGMLLYRLASRGFDRCFSSGPVIY